jgi:ribose/xylose/arabinose/galactoside ABC-type transport system permease subunit
MISNSGFVALIKKHGLIVAFAIFLVVVSLSADGFLSVGNMLDVLRQVSITGMIATGTTFVVITGRLDLSVGSMLTLLTVILVDQHNQVGPLAALLVTIAAALAIGAFNGFLVGYLKLNALINRLIWHSRAGDPVPWHRRNSRFRPSAHRVRTSGLCRWRQ